jgi:hypothetical protein
LLNISVPAVVRDEQICVLACHLICFHVSLFHSPMMNQRKKRRLRFGVVLNSWLLWAPKHVESTLFINFMFLFPTLLYMKAGFSQKNIYESWCFRPAASVATSAQKKSAVGSSIHD